MALGFIWYHPKVLSTVWMTETGLTEEKMKASNMALIFGISFILAFMLSLAVTNQVIYQLSVDGALYYAMKDPARKDAAVAISNQFKEAGVYASDGRSIKDGLIHGIIAALFFMLPILATNAMFERKSFKYIFLHAGFWIICLSIMGGIVCAWK